MAGGPESLTQGDVTELSSRKNDGIEVTLLWLVGVEPPLRVDVVDTKHGSSFSVPVLEGQSPKHVFNHPYAYEGQTAAEPAEEGFSRAA